MENLKPEDVAESILHVLASPPHVQVNRNSKLVWAAILFHNFSPVYNI